MSTATAPAIRTVNPIYVAIDTPDLAAAVDLARALRGAVGGLKVGLEFFVAQGPDGVRALARERLPVFLDLKLHDIPNTVAGAARAAATLGAGLLTVHASGGRAMLRAAVAAARESPEPPKVVAVTVLTSLDAPDLHELGIERAIEEQVRRMAALAHDSGCDGVVCSANEVAMLRAEMPLDFVLVVPGLGAAKQADQKRVDTPANAIRNGADVLVIGRGITRASNPRAAAVAFFEEIAAARRASAN